MQPGYVMLLVLSRKQQDFSLSSLSQVVLGRDSKWTRLEAGGMYDGTATGNDNFRMEAFGMELLMTAVQRFLN